MGINDLSAWTVHIAVLADHLRKILRDADDPEQVHEKRLARIKESAKSALTLAETMQEVLDEGENVA